MTKKELINTANTLDIVKENESFYIFAGKLLESSADFEKGNDLFFASVKIIKTRCRNGKTSDPNLMHALGKSGNSKEKSVEAERWCDCILNNSGLQDLTFEELKYVMATAARLCKISEKRKEDTSFEELPQKRKQART